MMFLLKKISFSTGLGLKVNDLCARLALFFSFFVIKALICMRPAGPETRSMAGMTHAMQKIHYLVRDCTTNIKEKHIRTSF